MKTKGVRITKTGSALVLVGSKTPHERNRQIDAVCKSVDSALGKTEKALGLPPPAQRSVSTEERIAAEAFADADAVLARMNFKMTTARARQPCSCGTARSCESCSARAAILSSRGDYL